MKNEILYAVISIALALLLICIVAPYSQAQTLRVDLVIVKQSDITTKEQLEIFKQGAKALREVGTRVKITSVTEVEDVLLANGFSSYIDRLFYWADWAKANKIRSNSRHMH